MAPHKHKRSVQSRAINCIKYSGLTYSEFVAKTPWWRLSHITFWGNACEEWLKEQMQRNQSPLWFWED
jgi:hypothetical protein